MNVFRSEYELDGRRIVLQILLKICLGKMGVLKQY